MSAKPFPPVFATNRPSTGETVAEEVNRMLSGLRTALVSPPNLALATAYLNPQGFALIADEVEQAPHVRILLGADPEEPFRRRIERGEDVAFEEVSRAHLDGLRVERDLVGFNVESDAAARRLVAWLRSVEDETVPRVEVRRFTKGFLHGKAFVAEHPVSPAVLAGSSNLTLAGLSWNRELNLGYPAGQHTGLVVDWYNELWDESEPFDLAGMYEERWQPHPPWVVFLRMLYELYGTGRPEGDEERIELPVTEFQRDGILRAMRIIEELGGVLVCDEVGLGKTFIAGEVIRIVSQRERQKVLIVVPASLKDSTWMPFLKRFDLVSARVDVVTYDELRLDAQRAQPRIRYDDYSLVVIDEAHNLRNAATQRAAAVMQMLWGEYPKKVLLLTATPVNNSLRDLHTLISYFVRNDAQFAPSGIPSLAKYIADAQRQDPETLSPEHLFDLMDRVAVRRTRRFIKKEYVNDLIRNNRGELVPIEFPTPVVKRVTYTLDKQAEDMVGRVIHALAVSDDEELVIRSGSRRDPSRLSLARYAPSMYSLGNDVDKLEITNVGLLRSGLLKRLESSTQALIKTFERLIASQKAFLGGLDIGVVLVGDALREYAVSDADSLEEFLDSLDGKAADQVEPVAGYEVDALRRDVAGDVDLLEELLGLARKRHKKGPDAKHDALVVELTTIAKEAARPDKSGVSSGDRRKIIIFSTYTDTVEDLHDRVVGAIDAADDDSPLAVYRGRVAPAIFGARGGMHQQERADAIASFCPMTAGEVLDDGSPVSPDLYDVLITTDVLAEGVNLQQAGRLASYDLPWNPMKLVQRHGRIDRIGSPHKRVVIDCFFPAKNLDALLHLEETLQRKIAYANAAIGAGAVLPDQIADPNVEVLLHDNRKEIMNLYNEDAVLLAQGGGSAALSGEEYRRRLGRALGDSQLREMVLGLPYGSGSGFVSKRVRQAGYVFCVRIGDHAQPWFRFVAADAASWVPLNRRNPLTGGMVPWIDSDLLTCLIAADPGDNHLLEQTLSDEATTGVFASWERARDDVYHQWTELTDWANLEPQIEKALRDAIFLVGEYGGHLGVDVQGDLIARLNGRWERGIVKSVREILRREDLDERRKADKLLEYVTEAGLPIPERAKPLAPVRIEDVRLVCWMAVSPEVRA
ncbi:MAG: helicase [Actinobacteria bacterium]|uniref:Unannotated protein n=1 Tax=freshwater metagenome TaxID=449393 RepID=A0A6J6X5R9_9ZZZZ|nr:helicase [Actinomycetota bacterium]MSX78876.1 helicase [Actinomycetota bacterium]